MLKERINYQDYNGVERSEDFYFNLTEAETMEMEMLQTGGMAEYIQRIIDAQNVPEVITIFKELILKAYGEKSLDGRRFVKSKELSEAFSQTEAYSKLFMKLSTDSNAAAAFINGIIPNKKANPEVPATFPTATQVTQ